MIDLESYLNTSKASESLLLPALGYRVAICPPNSRVSWMRPSLPPLVVVAHGQGRGVLPNKADLVTLNSQQPFPLEQPDLTAPWPLGAEKPNPQDCTVRDVWGNVSMMKLHIPLTN